MSKPSMRRETAEALATALGVASYPHAARTVIATALDGLTRTAKNDLIAFLGGTPPPRMVFSEREGGFVPEDEL